MTIEIYTDGSCIGVEPQRHAGYGVHFASSSLCGADISAPLPVDMGPQTNQRAELMAILAALQRLDARLVAVTTPVVVYSDSTYSIKCVTTWRHAWARNGWLTAKREPVKNRDLIQPLCELYDRRQPSLRLEWIRGHATSVGNQRADALACAAAAAAAASSRE